MTARKLFPLPSGVESFNWIDLALKPPNKINSKNQEQSQTFNPPKELSKAAEIEGFVDA